MILFFSDLHLGLRLYSVQDGEGFFTAEKQAVLALEKIYERAKKSDVTAIIFGGDWSHTNYMTSVANRITVYIMNKFESLGKPFYIIPGNHDSGTYTNTLSFLHENIEKNIYKNIFLVDKEVKKLSWKDYDLYLIPFIYGNSFKDREAKVKDLIQETLKKVTKKSILVTHVQETSAILGSEQNFISKAVEHLDLGDFKADHKITFLLGHIHQYQNYTKGCCEIIYPGNTFYHDKSDCNSPKGYVLFKEDGAHEFEEIPELRKFINIKVPGDVDILTVLESEDVVDNSLYFINKEINSLVDRPDEKEIRNFLSSKGSALGKIYINSNIHKQGISKESSEKLVKVSGKSFREDLVSRLISRVGRQDVGRVISHYDSLGGAN